MANNDRVADVYYRRADVTETQDACRDRIHWLCRQVQGQRVLDIGCSQGISAIILAREGHEAVGIDIEAQPLETARELLAKEPEHIQQRVSFVLGDAFSADFEPGSFDTVIMGEVIEHLTSPERLLERVDEWLTEGGRLVVSVPHGYHPYHDHKRSLYLGSLVELLGGRFTVATVEVVAERFLCAVALRPPDGQAPQLPSVERLLEWQRQSDANVEDAQRRHHSKSLAWLEKRRELEERSAGYRESVQTLKGASDEARRQARSAQDALDQERAHRISLAKREEGLTRKLDVALKDAKQAQNELSKAQAQLESERKQRRQAESNRVRMQNQAELYRAELTLREQEVRYQLGDALVRAAHPSLDTFKLPFRMVKLFFAGVKRVRQRRQQAGQERGAGQVKAAARPGTPASPPEKKPPGEKAAPQRAPASPTATVAPLAGLDAISTLAEPFSRTPPDQLRRSDLCIAAVTDEFSWRAWQYEAETYTFTPQTWREALEARQPDLLLIESAWSGLENSWYFQVRDLCKRGEVIKYYAIPDIIAWCRQHDVPTVFYNKEDPPNFDVFVDAAKQFDFVFTSDANCIPDYRKHVGHERVFALPFAAQPRIHNPIMTGTRIGSVCFAGTWYSHRHFARHEDANKILRPALDFDLHIFDRMANSGNPNYRWPDEYLTAIRGALPYSQMLAAYKRYKVFMNINSVKNSPTMFSRRVFELLACGTPVISSYSEGVEELLGADVVLMSDDESTTREALERILGDDEYRERLALRGQRKVFSRHTYMHRLNTLLKSIGIDSAFDARPRMTCVCPVEDADDIAPAQKMYQRQDYDRRALIFCTNDSAVAQKAKNAAQDIPDARVILAEDATWGQVIKQAIDTAAEGRVALINPRDSYGPFYLTDYAHATYYVDHQPIGKAHYLASEGGAEPVKAGKPSVCRYVSEVYPWTLCLSRADALTHAVALVGARSPWEWCNRATRATERFYSPDRFSYIRCEEVTPTGRTPVAVSRADAQRGAGSPFRVTGWD